MNRKGTIDVKRNGLGGWALVALVCVGATLVVARRWFHDGDAPTPAPVPVAGLANSPVAGAQPATGPSPGTAPVSNTAVSAAQAMEMRLAAERGTDAEYASYLNVNVRLRPGQTFADYVADLETRIARSDTAAMVKMAQILDRCWSAKSIAEDAVAYKREAEDDYDQKLQTARMCEGTLVLPDYAQVRDRGAELVAEAARRGDEAAILAQFQHSPVRVGADPLSEGSRAWVNEAAGRLAALASAGNSKAALALGGLYSDGSFTPQDFPKAAPYFRQVLDNAPMRKEEALARSLMPGPDMGRYNEIYVATLEAEGMLRMICKKSPPDSIAPGVCK
ncbi:MAG: hypothetical protein NW204_09430 [Xanthomonadaceae bacterium]|nr:hypothetical protein [Xanthomonadaceae bacterium]